MREYFLRKMERLAPILMVTSHDLPGIDSEQVSVFSREFIFAGTPAFRMLYYTMILVLQALCLLRCGRSIYSLTPPEAEDFVESLYASRLTLVNAIPILLSMPFYLAHYGRDDVQEVLGFEIRSLREEALQREVRR